LAIEHASAIVKLISMVSAGSRQAGDCRAQWASFVDSLGELHGLEALALHSGWREHVACRHSPL
jgi:hypothetical protein